MTSSKARWRSDLVSGSIL